MFPPAPHVDLPLFLRFVFNRVSVWVCACECSAFRGWRGCWVPETWSYRWCALLDTDIGTTLGCHVGAACFPGYWAISPAPMEAQKCSILIKFNLITILLLVLRGSYLKTHCQNQGVMGSSVLFSPKSFLVSVPTFALISMLWLKDGIYLFCPCWWYMCSLRTSAGDCKPKRQNSYCCTLGTKHWSRDGLADEWDSEECYNPRRQWGWLCHKSEMGVRSESSRYWCRPTSSGESLSWYSGACPRSFG